MRCNFGGLGTCPACAFQVLSDLLAARTRCVEVLLGVALNLGRSASASGDLVAKLSKPVGQLRLVHGGRELLGGKQTLWLQCAILAAFPFSHVEDDGVRVELWRDVAIHGPGGVVFELRGNELRCRLRCVIASDPRLCVMLKLLQRNANTRAMSIAHLMIP